jgi:hypothetical protein
MHTVEESKIDMSDLNFCMQVSGKTGGHFADDPVLTESSMNENPRCQDKKKQRSKKPAYYFPEFPQIQYFKL